MHLIARRDCHGATSAVYDGSSGEPTLKVEFRTPLDTLIVDDRRMEHDVSRLVSTGAAGYRDVVLIDYDQLEFSRSTVAAG